MQPRRWWFCVVGLSVVLSASAYASPWQEPLSIATSSLPPANAASHYDAPLQASGGGQPYTWHLGQGSSLPPGLKLHPHAGRISGTPTKAGEYHFTLVLADSNVPSATVQREFIIHVISALTIEWKRPPNVSGTWLAGSLVVTNHTEHAVTLTVIVVAVNAIGRATALGYQHFRLASNADQEIPFGASPGPGAYVVHADAVAHEKGLRTRKDTSTEQPLVIQQI